MAPMRVILRTIRNSYVLIIHPPGRCGAPIAHRAARRPFAPMMPGDVVRAPGRNLRITRVERRIDRRGDRIEHVVEIFTTSLRRRSKEARRHVPANVVAMPAGDGSSVAQFIRFHVLVRAYDGNPDSWLARLREDAASGVPVDGADLRFVHWIRSRLRRDPGLLDSIRRMVEATPFWRAAKA